LFEKVYYVITTLLNVNNTSKLKLEIENKNWTIFYFVPEKLPMPIPVFVKHVGQKPIFLFGVLSLLFSLFDFIGDSYVIYRESFHIFIAT